MKNFFRKQIIRTAYVVGYTQGVVQTVLSPKVWVRAYQNRKG